MQSVLCYIAIYEITQYSVILIARRMVLYRCEIYLLL